MVKSASELLAELDSAIKGITDVSELGDSILQAQKFDQFVRQMEDNAVVLSESRFLPMESHIVDIDRVGFSGRILRGGELPNGDHVDLEESEFATVSTATNTLTAKELHAVTSLRDRALRRNIERGGFEDTLISLFGEAAGRDFEEYALLGDTANTDDDVLQLTDGWVKRAGQRVFGGGSDFDPTSTDADGDPDWVEAMFASMIDALPKRFLQNVTDWRFYVTFEMLVNYRRQLKKRQTDLGDQNIGNFPTASSMFEGIPVVYAPLLQRAQRPTANQVVGRLALLTNPDNMVWGVFHEVTIEREREAKARRTDFVLSFEGDADYEDESAAVAAFVDYTDFETPTP